MVLKFGTSELGRRYRRSRSTRSTPSSSAACRVSYWNPFVSVTIDVLMKCSKSCRANGCDREKWHDGSSQKAKQKRLISVISLFSRLSRPKEAAFGFVDTALCVCYISGVFPYILEFPLRGLALVADARIIQ